MSVSIPWLLRKTQLQRNQPDAATEALPAPVEELRDPVDISSDGSFPASDPPSFTPTSGSVHGDARPNRKP